MSSFLFPSLTGQQYNYTRKYNWGTPGVQKSLSTKTSTIIYQQWPTIMWEFAFEFLRDQTFQGGGATELSALVSLYNAVRGRYDTFLFTDPDFNTISVANAPTLGIIGTGNGSNLGPFQLMVLYAPPGGQYSAGAGASEIVQNLNGTPILYANNVAISSSNYSIGPTGLVTFGAGHAPANGAVLTWSGSFYYRCRFDSDDYDFKKIMNKIWMLDKLDFSSVIL